MDASCGSSHGINSKSTGAVDLLMEISTILNTGLDRASLSILLSMLEHGVHPEALARVVLELDRELLNVKSKEQDISRVADVSP